ncbi:MAG: hypothetical protein B7Z75_14800 [Acidocella sp. 20-57-95]|nr:MAG: hypothetical protein B7Z75_14800 [Acidocella sp. 20-57-95]
MIGDPKQMQAVEAGPVIELLRRALGAGKVPELGSSVRQKAEEERETVLMFRNGQTEEAVRRKDANGTLQIVPGGYEEAVARVAGLWRKRLEANRDRPDFSISVSAPSNAEAHDISLAIRQQRQSKPPMVREHGSMNWRLPWGIGFACFGVQTPNSQRPARSGISAATGQCWKL